MTATLTGSLFTYMLTEGEIKALCDQAKLFKVTPNDWRAPIMRSVYLSPDIHRFLNEPSNNSIGLQRLFDRFISGQVISVAFEPRFMGTQIKRLSPRRREVWEFKIRDRRRPQLRVFGRFADAKIFFALTGPVAGGTATTRLKSICARTIGTISCQGKLQFTGEH